MGQIDDIVAQSRASQNKIELKKVLQYVGELQPKIIVEIGVHKGYSLEVWKKAFDPEIIVGIENNEGEIDPKIEVPIIIADSHKKETVEILKGILRERQIDFLFIDGDHTYDGVRSDYELYSPLVRRGGIIGFHDTALDSNEWRSAGVDVHSFFFKELIAPASTKYLVFWDEVGKGTGTGLYYVK